MMEYRETLHDNYGQFFAVSRVLFRQTTPHHDLVIFENPIFGKVLALNGAIQTTEHDNHIYHEMFAHVPILSHGAVKSVLIVGGGDGGVLREVVKHPVDRVVLVDIDRAVIDICQEHIPEIAQGAFADQRATVVIADGAEFVRRTDDRFDVILVDSTDPEPASEALYSASFYASCRNCLCPGGVVVTMSGTPFLQPDALRLCHRNLSQSFPETTFYFAAVPSYTGGPLAFGWATDDVALTKIDIATIGARLRGAGIVVSHYTPAMHFASFARPHDVDRLLN